MGLPRALKAHREGDVGQALLHYQRALDQQVHEAVLFQNYGALLREQGKLDEAAALYERGLALFPTHPGIRGNRANLLRSSSPATAVHDNLLVLRQLLVEGAEAKVLQNTWVTLLSQLRDLGLLSWALSLAIQGLTVLGNHPPLLLGILLIAEELANDPSIPTLRPLEIQAFRDQLEAQLDRSEPLVQAEIRLGLAAHRLGEGDLEPALAYFEQAMAVVQQQGGGADPADAEKRQALVDVNSWNFAIALLKQQQLQRGWQLFEYGLRTPAEGKQRWQRALFKPFSSSELPLWRGESLEGKQLLMLEEQAIGDVMMFCTLVPSLLEEAAGIGLLVGDRLLPIYRRSLAALGFGDRLKVWSHAESRSGALDASAYQLQSPLGSICQYRFTTIDSYARHTPLLRAEPERTQQLRRDYLNHGQSADRLIGISWRGGGKGVRILQKSMAADRFAQLLQPIPGVRFVSLQYGNAAPCVETWRQQGLDVVHDPRVDPLKQMDLWLAQVAACDAVLSVANTTIHGAGGLGLPTLCLLSTHSDWRWFDDPAVTRSYWYPSVGIAREQKQGGWEPALQQARRWIEQGCPMPAGPISTLPA